MNEEVFLFKKSTEKLELINVELVKMNQNLAENLENSKKMQKETNDEILKIRNGLSHVYNFLNNVLYNHQYDESKNENSKSFYDNYGNLNSKK